MLEQRPGPTIPDSVLAKVGMAPKSAPPSVAARGPGSILAERLRMAGASTCGSCRSLADEMDRLGPDGCMEKIDALTKQIIDNARANPSTIGMMMSWTPMAVASVAVRTAITACCKEAKEVRT